MFFLLSVVQNRNQSNCISSGQSYHELTEISSKQKQLSSRRQAKRGKTYAN